MKLIAGENVANFSAHLEKIVGFYRYIKNGPGYVTNTW